MKNNSRHTLVDQIYYALKNKLIGLEFERGEHLSSEDLVRQYDTTPEIVQEALGRLAREDFLTLTKDGARVVSWEAADIEEIQSLALALDALVMKDIFALPDHSILLKELSIISDRFNKSDNPEDYARWAEQFSKALYRSIGSKRLLHMASAIKAQQQMLRNQLLYANQHRPQLEEHSEIMAGIEQGDLEQAMSALQSAYQKKTQALLAIMA